MNGGFGVAVSSSVIKTGRGTLNIRGVMTGFGSGFSVEGGTANFLSGASTQGTIALALANPNAGSTVTVNIQTSIAFRVLTTSPVGSESATLNLIGAGTKLQSGGTQSGNFRGVIAGQGSLSFGGTGTQTLSGNNTYSGTTEVGGIVQLDGVTSGQGNYLVSGYLVGSGKIGLAPGASVLVATGGFVSPGGAFSSFQGFTTLHVEASGGGAAAFNGGTFLVHLGAAGMSDLLAIEGGGVDLTSTGDRLVLTDQGGAFDGYDYTIATFSQNVNGGTFNTVQGLSGGYAVQYNPTSIKLLAPQLPLQITAAVSRKTHGALGPGPWDLNLLTTEPVECRSSGGSHTLVFTFSNAVVSGSAIVTAGEGQVSGAPTFSGRTMTVNLAGVSDAQKLSVTLQNVTDRFSQMMPDAIVMINLLIGDVNGDRVVNAGDALVTRNRSGNAAGGTNFRSDINLDGVVNSGDGTIIRARSGASVP
jgi:autotransporter-associated beta strand protein